MTAPVILWFRRDLRLADQPALAAAVASGAPVIPLYILDDDTPKHRKMGAASRWWLHHSLMALDADLRALGSRLILRAGKSDEILGALAEETKAAAIHCIRHYEPWWRNAEKAVAHGLHESCSLICYDGNYLLPAGAVTTGSGGQYKIYTPFMRALWKHMPPPAPLAPPTQLAAPQEWPVSEDIGAWNLLPTKPDWSSNMVSMWTPGAAGAEKRLEDFVDKAKFYDEKRNLPSVEGSSFLSAHLHFGEISPAACWHATMQAGGSVDVFLKELVWRDYAQNVIVQMPEYGTKNARDAFDKLPWRDLSDPAVNADFVAWTKGRTGYPIVDAGMRQLWATGWMHNRVRMIAASFLVKHLLIDWREGEKWFWDTLVDADYGSNSVNWQWTAGTGVDSNMFVRIMAPLSQSEKFDAARYIREWVPELAELREPYIHDPDEYGARPKNYPRKIIGHKAGRERVLAAFTATKN
ncbi:deoxyribodipyrimidine photo-lyase [Sphingorhabdus sp. EL138]|uniref:cryptochrome/photolyase family protein n=1 Tax=Sphingorhabdus sp. EL138 TaxID=2073156 RepID=UPI0025EA4CB9|nr:deoxyribodipyrimidine photo-lyase [Sphingorhabdus sp. EL138]